MFHFPHFTLLIAQMWNRHRLGSTPYRFSIGGKPSLATFGLTTLRMLSLTTHSLFSKNVRTNYPGLSAPAPLSRPDIGKFYITSLILYHIIMLVHFCHIINWQKLTLVSSLFLFTPSHSQYPICKPRQYTIRLRSFWN